MFRNPSLSADGGFDNSNIVTPGIPALAAAATIAPKRQVTRVTGTVPVATITPPDPYFNGPLFLYSSDATPFTTVTTGNIALATTVTRYQVLTLVYDPGAALWYPSY